ncbi:hypothetical protein HanPI659440_Chr17g0695561 [Helianthus annuus]|nr:hypothetical protein HanPI659440_Chr17g0695561 [Helianthus annuus]
MHYRSESDGVPRVAVSIAFADEDWYKTLSRRATLMIQLEERAPVAAGMSMLWVPRDPRAYLDYTHKGRGYSMMNVFDSKVAGGMAVAALPKGEPGWVSRIRDNFLHPSNESMATYANVILGDNEDESDVDVVPTREELILLSSRRGPTQELAGKGRLLSLPALRLISPRLLRPHLLPPPPPVPFDVSPPHLDPNGKGKEGHVEGDATEKVVQSVAPGVVVQEGGMRVEGAKTDWESSEATLQGTIYTRRGPPTPGGGGPSGSWQGLEFRRVEGGGSWTEHNPACDDLPHAPRWGLTQDKLAKEKQFNANRQKDWEAACEISNRDLKSARDEVVKLKAEKAKDSQEYERLAVAHKEKEAESQARIAALEKTVEEQSTQNKALKLLAEDLGADCKWLLAHGIPLIADRLVKSDELAKYMFELGGAAYDNGRKDGYGEGKVASLAKDKDYQFEL